MNAKFKLVAVALREKSSKTRAYVVQGMPPS
jgi:hypothetical protein